MIGSGSVTGAPKVGPRLPRRMYRQRAQQRGTRRRQYHRDEVTGVEFEAGPSVGGATRAQEPDGRGAGKVAGFSLHTGVVARADQREKLERLCRYVGRPTVSDEGLSLTSIGYVSN